MRLRRVRRPQNRRLRGQLSSGWRSRHRGTGAGESGRLSLGVRTGCVLSAAVEGFDHLQDLDEACLDDGPENIIDNYCALLASAELYGATRTDRFRQVATERTRALLARQTSDDRYDGWLRVVKAGDRPYFHAAEAGLPVLALCRYGRSSRMGRSRPTGRAVTSRPGDVPDETTALSTAVSAMGLT